MSPALRIAVIATGTVGTLVAATVLERDGLDLVAVWVHSEGKADRDVGELLGGPPTGVRTTRNLDDVIAQKPDCAVYTASGPELDAVNVPMYCRLLRAGINVVTVSTPGLVYPRSFNAGLAAQLDEAAAEGGASLYASGVEPGFAGDQLAALLTTMSRTITSVRTQEIFCYDTYPDEFMMRDVFGFGKPLDFSPMMQSPGVQQHAWGPPVHYVAAALGVTLDEIRETYERQPTPRDLTVACGVIEAGTCGAVRMESIGVVDGRDAIVIEHVNRMAPDLAPDWPTALRDGTYRVTIEGSPNVMCELTIGDPGAAGDEGMVATAMRCLNAVPYVVAAPPGLVSSLELPLTTPIGALASSAG